MPCWSSAWRCCCYTSGRIVMDTHAATHPPQRPKGLKSRWYFRVPAKWVLVALICFFVCFPNLPQFARQVHHLCNLQAMIEPDAPELDPWKRELQIKQKEIRKDAKNGEPTSRGSDSEMLKDIQAFV